MNRQPPPRRLLEGGAESPDEQALAALFSELPPVEEAPLQRERIWRSLSRVDRRPSWKWGPRP